MTIVTTSEAQTTLARLIARVAQGEEVLITEDGLAVAQLVRPNLQEALPTLPAAQPSAPAPSTIAREAQTGSTMSHSTA